MVPRTLRDSLDGCETLLLNGPLRLNHFEKKRALNGNGHTEGQMLHGDDNGIILRMKWLAQCPKHLAILRIRYSSAFVQMGTSVGYPWDLSTQEAFIPIF